MRWSGAILLGAAACTGGPGGETDGGGGDLSLHALLTLSPEIPSVGFATWTPPGTGASHVEFGLTGGPLDHSTPVGPDSSSASVTVLGFKAGQTYDWRAVTVTDDGKTLTSEVQSIDIPPPAQGMPSLALTIPPDPSRSAMAAGYLVMSIISPTASYVAIIDGDGDYVWYHEAAPATLVTTSRPGLDGTSVLWASYDNKQTDDIGLIERWSLDGTVHTTTRTLLAHHDFYEQPEGILAWTGYLFRTYTINSQDFLIASDAIREAPEGTQEETDDQVYDHFDDYYADPWIICQHMQDSVITYNGQDAQEWTHTNSIMFDDSTDSYYLMSKFMDALIKIDRETGQPIWQINGMYGTFTHEDGGSVWRSPDDVDLWSHAHMSQIWDDGAMIFDNGYHYVPQWSGAIEVAFDQDAHTVEKVWEYKEPNGGFTPLMGDVRLVAATDTVLIGWSDLARITEVTHDDAKAVVWQIDTPVGYIFGRLHYATDLYHLDPP